MSGLHFDQLTVLWTDRSDFEDELARRRATLGVDDTDAELLQDWARDGFVRFPALIEPAAVEGLLADAEAAWRERPRIDVNISGLGIVEMPEAPLREQIGHHHYRLLDLQDVSESARRIALGRRLSRFLRLLFDDVPVAMQSLFFEYPSEQETHQDFPFVQARILSHLVGCWIACEEVDERNGPLVYYPGSHRLPKFDWGGGNLAMEGEDAGRVAKFTDYLERASTEAGLERRILKASQGDVLLWHGALAHGGAPAEDPEATRKTFVVHYSSATAYPRDRRTPKMRPHVHEENDARLYLRRRPGPLGKLRRRIGDLVRNRLR